MTRDYSLSGAVFAAFGNSSGAETLSGTWSVDYSTMTVTALALTATGAETLDFNIGGVGSLTFTGGGGATQYEIDLTSTQSTPLYLDYQASDPPSAIANSYNGFQSNLYNTGFAYSGLTTPGDLSGVPFGATVPEPVAWASMLIGVLGVGGQLRRSRRAGPVAASPVARR